VTLLSNVGIYRQVAKSAKVDLLTKPINRDPAERPKEILDTHVTRAAGSHPAIPYPTEMK